MSRTRTTLPFHWPSLLIAALTLGPVMQSAPAAAETHAAWVQLDGPGRDASIRVITDEAQCPTLNADGADLRMQVRAAPGPLFKPGTDAPPASFFVSTCEVIVPPGKSSILLDGKSLPLPPADFRRIVVFGDTGCRINKKKKRPQDCVNDWPYQKIARHAAAARPDLVIHVGDYLYRESCNADTTDCSKTPTGYGWEEWRDSDALLHKHIVYGTLAPGAAVQELMEGYKQARAAGPSPREWASVLDHIWFLAVMISDQTLPCYNPAAAAALNEILSALALERSR
jgi:hypothetical protein